MISARSFLVRGLLAGLVAGIVAFGVAYLVGEPSVNAAIGVEDSAGAGHSHADEAETAPGTGAVPDESAGHGHREETVVPRSLQSTAGLLTGTVLAGVTLGGLVGVLSALALGRFGRVGPRATTLSVAATGFVALYVVPFLTYPPNPPAVGSGDTIGYRTALYFILLAISVVAVVAAVLLGRAVGARSGGWYATLAAVGGYLVVVLVATALLPTYDEVPQGFPASVLYDFRRASFLTQLALWTVLGVLLAELVGRLADRARVAVPDRRPLNAEAAS